MIADRQKSEQVKRDRFMTFEEYKKKYSLQLTDQQDRAVQAVDGPVLVLAVPGAGKTTVLVARLGYMLLCRGIRPEEILTVTYTVAATRDMRRRFERMFGEICPGAERLEFRTINGICARVIAEYGRKIGKEPFALQTDEGEIQRLLRGLYIEEAKAYPTESETADLRSRVSYIKNMQFSGRELEELDEEAGYPLSEIYRRYCSAMKQQGLMDYDDQMVYALTILTRCPELLQEYRERYQYLCVDEAQDTSKIQHRILKLLAGNGNLFMVGDEDQSIYGFRAAYPEALLSFEQDHSGAKILLMERNFRSDAAIVKAANQLIQKNTLRHPKRMIPVREQESRVRIFSVKKREDQYAYLAEQARECVPGQMEEKRQETTAVLYRNNESAVPLIDRLEREGIPYNVRSADLSFFTSRVIYDVIGIYHFLQNPGDTGLFLQIYYKLNLYVSKKAAEEVCSRVRSKALQKTEEAQRAEQGRAEKVQKAEAKVLAETEKTQGKSWAVSRKNVQTAVNGVPDQMDILTALVRDPGTPEYVRKAVREVRRYADRILHGPALTALQLIDGPLGYGAYLERMGLGRGRLDLLEVLAESEPSIESLLARMDALQTTIREKEYDPQCGFLLSTIHASKGLEYDRVFLMDVGDGVFPGVLPPEQAGNSGSTAGRRNAHRPYSGESRDSSMPGTVPPQDTKRQAELSAFEEERRIFYVGITRARNELTILKLPQGSEFANELLPQASSRGRKTKEPVRQRIATGRNPSDHGRHRTPAEKNGFGHDRYGLARYSEKADRKEPDPLVVREFCEQVREGHRRVIHARYGSGDILKLDEKKKRIMIQFDDGMQRKLDLAIAVGTGLLELRR